MDMAAQSPEPVSLARKFAAFTDRWSPKIVGQVNDVLVKVAKLEGEFPWHVHEAEDELFLVVRGRLRLQFRDGERVVGEGEFLVVPRGVEHRPVADEEVHVVLIEPAGTLNTGNVRNERTIEDPEWI
jgi:mannose-6-phosphate isomerase-like protein (cupin superfamily)